MGFLDNSGDIILDAVLTDTGRMRLAKGDGSFRITKFALGDDEINYSLYDKTSASGSAYFDLNILLTPIFEAFTNNVASLNSRLVSISRTNLLFLPVLKINDLESSVSNFGPTVIVNRGYILAVDKDTEEMLASSALIYNGTAIGPSSGVLKGFQPNGGVTVRLDQGIDSTSVPASIKIDPDLKETQYLVEIDNRFGSIIDPSGLNVATPSFVDDDDMATYYFSQGTDPDYVMDNPDQTTVTSANLNTSNQVIAGSRGTTLKFKIKSALEVATSDYLFNQIGTNITTLITGVTVTNVRSIITTVKVTGLTTGYSVDVPLVVMKKIS